MSDLQLALIVLSAAVLLAVFLHGKWQQQRALRQLNSRLRGGVDETLFDRLDTDRFNARPGDRGAGDRLPGDGGDAYGGRREPAFGEFETLSDRVAEAAPVVGGGDRTPPATISGRASMGRMIPAASAVGAAVAAAVGGGASASPNATASAGAGVTAKDRAPRAETRPSTDAWIEDPLLDLVVEVRCTHPVDGVAVIDAAAPLSTMESTLPVHLVVWDAKTQQWVAPDRFGFYADILVAIQMADRRHVLDEIDASRFIATVQQIALGLDADFDVPDVRKMVQQAAELDQTCAPFDLKIGVTLESSAGPWEPPRLQAAALAAGLVRVAAGRWEYLVPSAAGAPAATLFSLSSASLLTDRLALELDVPTAPVAADPLRTMLARAEHLADALQARLIDDNGRPIDATSIASIETHLADVYTAMRTAGVEPGGLRALRFYGVGAGGRRNEPGRNV